jgi:type IV pilus assembly protein PilY1
MKRYFLIVLALIFIFSSRLGADDTSIYGTTSISVTPNILIIFDTSGSMSTVDVPGEYYNPDTTYSGSYTNGVVYQKVSGWMGSWNYEVFASSTSVLNCPAVKTALETYGQVEYGIQASDGGYTCPGSTKDLYMGNWINYDESDVDDPHSRISVAKETIKAIINDEDNANVRFGLMRFNNNQGGRIVQACGTDTATLISSVDSLTADGSTPLAETLAEAGLYFAGKESWYNSSTTYNTPMQYRCQKNYIILMTDGEPTNDLDWRLSSGTYINGDTIGDYDEDGNESGGASDYLDDVAKYLYENDLNSSMGTSGDSFEKQNIITYTIGFQTQQQLLQDTATNGGGMYYTANSISGLSAAFERIMTDIADVNAVFVSPVVPVSRMNRTFAGNSLYVGFFKPQSDGRWGGNIKKYGLDSDGNIIDANGYAATQADGTIKDNARSFWSVSADGPNVLQGGIGGVLLDQANRNLYTYMGSQASLTHTSNAFSTSNTDITTATLGVSTDTQKDTVINDIHGEGRDWILGDILHSEPSVVHYDTDGNGTLDESFLFAGTNDGMIHCFKDSDGSEAWGFIPPDQLSKLQQLSDSNTVHDYFVDGAPAVYQTTGQKILFFGERRGGSDYYALDVTTYNAPSYLYKIAATFLANIDGDGIDGVDGDNANLGQSWCTPTVHKIKTSSGSDTVFLLGGGYDTNQDLSSPAVPDGLGRAVFTIKVADGSISSLNVNAGYYTDMTHCIVDVSGFDSSGNGNTNRVYAGDLGGSIFAFEDDDQDGTWSRRKFFSASAQDGVQRKIFYSPDAVEESFGEIIFFGTGDRADPEKTTVVNRIYAIKNSWEDLGTFTTLTESDLTDVTDNLIVLGTETQKTETREALSNSKGWYIRLENSGEKVLSSVTVFNGVLYFTTYTPEAGVSDEGEDPCEVVSGRGQARLYALNYKTGEAAFEYSEETETDAEGNVVTRGKHDRSKVIGTSIASAPSIAVLEGGPRIYIGADGGIPTEDPDVTAALNTYYWRQIND